jgi:ABC-type multidrug transport system ATPase subunit
MTAALRITNLRHAFPVGLGLRRQPVLHGIDLTLETGASLGLVGPNGSGKSTLLRVIAGIERPSSGDVHVLGATPASADVRRRIGFLPEDSPFPPELRALSALELLGSLRHVPRERARARGAELLERVGLADAARKPLSRFSRGMLRRFGLAQAVLHEPDLLLLDEPTAGLDATGFDALAELLAEARARGASTIVASHMAADLLESARLVVLMNGRVAATGAPNELLGDGGLLALYRRLEREPA